VSTRPIEGRTGARRRARWLAPALALLTAACGSSGGSTASSPHAPTISNLRVSYSPPAPITGAAVQVGLIVDVVDADGDWVGGQCEIITGNQVVLPVSTTGLPPNATSGTAICAFTETFGNDDRRIDLILVDQAGHASNVVSGEVILQGRQGRAARP
jgi:hypothetical protein